MIRLLTAFALVLAAHVAMAQAPNARALRTTLDSIVRTADGKIGIGVELLETRERIIAGDAGRHPMQSVYKLPIAMAVLDRVDAHRLRLDSAVSVPPAIFVRPGQWSPIRDKWPQGTRLTIRELIRYAVTESDGTACDVLLKLLGGTVDATHYLRRVGVIEMVAATTEREQGLVTRRQYENWATPAGALDVLRALRRPALSDSATRLLTDDLVSATRGAGRIRGRLPAGTVVAHKTGTSGTERGVTAATNDIGIATLPDGRHLAIAVLVTDSRANDAARDDVIARIARAAWDAYVPRP